MEFWPKPPEINGENLIINSAGLAGLACTYGGDYKFTHCTFNNNWNSSSQVALLVNNYYIGATPEVKDLTAATFNNCIIYGSYSNEMILNKKTGATFDYQFNNCLIKFNNTSNQYTNHPEYQFNSDPAHYNGIIQNKDPKFLKIAENKLNIDENFCGFCQRKRHIFGSTGYFGNHPYFATRFGRLSKQAVSEINSVNLTSIPLIIP